MASVKPTGPPPTISTVVSIFIVEPGCSQPSPIARAHHRPEIFVELLQVHRHRLNAERGQPLLHGGAFATPLWFLAKLDDDVRGAFAGKNKPTRNHRSTRPVPFPSSSALRQGAGSLRCADRERDKLAVVDKGSAGDMGERKVRSPGQDFR